MSLTKVTYSMIDGPALNIKDFGAVGDAAWTAQNVVTEIQSWFLTLTYFV